MYFAEIEKMVPRDIQRAMEIAEQCNLSPWSHRDYMDEFVRTDSIMLKARTSESSCSGFIVARRVPGDGREHDVEIYNIGVEPGLHRRKLGSNLLTAALDICKRFRVANIWLEVRASNHGAIAFYERFGFERSGIRRRFYRDPEEDALTMKLTL